MKNEGFFERLIQLTIASALFIGALFWLGDTWRLVAFVASFAIATFAIVGFCPLYAIIGKNKTCDIQDLSIKQKIALIVYVCTFIIIASYGSIFVTKKIFIEDFNAMNTHYKQVLFETGQGKREESKIHYDALESSWLSFHDTYSQYQPYILRGDTLLLDSLDAVDVLIRDAQQLVYDGDLHDAHLHLEKIRPITQDMLKRNNFSLFAISLVDFHDSMEIVLDKATNKDAQGVIVAYDDASEKLLAIEQLAQDEEVQSIRKNLEALRAAAQNGSVETLPSLGNSLKSSFVKVYLTRG